MKRASLAALLVLAISGSLAANATGDRDWELSRARQRAAEGRAYISLRILDEILEEEPEHEEALVLRAELLRRDGRFERARRDYEKWSELNPSHPTPWFWLATLDRWRGEIDLAAEGYARVLSLDPCHVDALLGRARIRRSQRDDASAIDDLRTALECRPEEPEALGLLAEALARSGAVKDAERTLSELNTEGAAQRREAARAVERLSRYLHLGARLDRSDVLEGVEEDGLVVDGEVLRPALVRYRANRVPAALVWKLSERVELATDLAFGIEAVENRDEGVTIYDFERFTGLVGLNHRLSPAWRFSWRAGASGYASRLHRTIPDEVELVGEAELEWRRHEDRFTSRYWRDTFVKRGFASDFQFRIFRRDRWALEYRRAIGGGVLGEIQVGGAHYDDGNDVPSGAIAAWLAGEAGAIWLRYGHEPFAARFLEGEENGLDFIDFDVVALAARLEFPEGFRLEGEGRLGLFGETARLVVDGGGNLVDGPLDRNEQRFLRAALAWRPPTLSGLVLGAEYFTDEYDFDTRPYDTIDTHSWTPWVELKLSPAPSWEISSRYGRGVLRDARVSRYTSHEASLRVVGAGARLDSPRVILEGLWESNSIEEEEIGLAVEVTVPF